ncbi:arginase [Sulfuriroseicoccus oceanibius]|uniref:Arginase n=1 Tax=Sulfuriroseicoccus oceanibius TaxID=2707525 RepID=A0A7T7F3P1_9BACT|nr:arginase [Sulfuriroseicoccus oceanibius]
MGAPVDSGARAPGCEMGPAAMRAAGVVATLAELGWDVEDLGDVRVDDVPAIAHSNPALHGLGETVAWTRALMDAAYAAARSGAYVLCLGGDHSLSAGTVAGVAKYAAELGRPQFVLWLDAHSDIHTLDTTVSGNLHGIPVAYFTGQSGFDPFPDVPHPVPAGNVCLLGMRSVDTAEGERLKETAMEFHDMREIDVRGVLVVLEGFLQRVSAAGGRLHVSLDVDFLDPGIAPAVTTPVAGGATLREAQLVMERLSDSGLVTSVDVAELNPFLDERGRTSKMLTDLVARLFGRTFLEAPTSTT